MNHSAIANIQQIHMAFRTLASHSHQGAENPNDPVGAFLSHHILGFMARFGDVVNDFQIQYSVIEKIRCLKGVEEMIKIGKKVIRVARPQVCFKSRIIVYCLTSGQIGLCPVAAGDGSKRASVCRLLCLGKNASSPRR